MKNFLIAAAVLIVLTTAAIVIIRVAGWYFGASEWWLGYLQGLVVMAIFYEVREAFK